MAKKRKAGSRGSGRQTSRYDQQPRSKLNIQTYEDVADSEDEFFINRDKILLDEGPEQKRRRKFEEDETLLEASDEEVFSEPSDASVSDDENLQDDEPFSPKLIPIQASRQDDGYASDVSDTQVRAEEEDINDWGPSRKDYYDADPITTEADALEEEAEARRLQKKQLQGMTEADFGLDEIDWEQAKKEWTADGEHDGKGKVISEVLPKVEITDSMSSEEKMKILRLRYPEFEPLAKEYIDLQVVYQDLSLASKTASAVDSTIPTNNAGISTAATVKVNALGGYLAALCMYFALLSATDMTLDDVPEPIPPAELHNHKIMDTLVKCRQLWEKVKDMDVPEPKPREIPITNGHQPPTVIEKALGVENQGTTTTTETPKPRKRKSRAEKKAARAFAAAQAESAARRLERLRQTEESLKDLASLTTSIPPPTPKAPTTTTSATAPTNNNINNDNNDNDDSDLGDPTALDPHEAAEKAARKKSLRFYTSQIAQKSNRRAAAGRDAGGDADIPYRERIRDRQARLNAEAEARGRREKKDTGVALDHRSDSGSEAVDGDGEDTQRDLATQLRHDQDADYYNLVSTGSRDRKTLKAAHAQAAREGGVVRILDHDAVVEEGGGKKKKRGITYAIEKNKGLVPNRRKEVRNPRVKRRKRFEDKKKKLGSVRAVWKGGEGRGGYQGELTGVKAGLVRSVKL
ncbi:MAG: hypothetical protein Q9219_007535 [cf. Caloplaca sp. 3 TL-2023]